MGGDSYLPSSPSTEEESESLLGRVFAHESIDSSVCSEDGDDLTQSLRIDGSLTIGESGLTSEDVVPRISLIDAVAERQKLKTYAEVLRSYEDLQPRIDKLEEAKNEILSYHPGSWAELAEGMDLSEFDVPNTTPLLLIGPEGSGKSSLVNKISRVLEDDLFLPVRAQVSKESLIGDGTYFLHEYMVPRCSGSFCLYDTRGLSVDSSENMTMIKRWMTKGVRHGELVERNSDSMELGARLGCKARRNCSSSQLKGVNFVIFVVNGISVLESMDGVDEKKKQYSQIIAENFNNPLLSFKDDKPIVVVTHGDLLSLSDRVRMRVHLGELLGIPPTRQIFDIPENDDPSTTLAIVDMLIYCLERADRNLPPKDFLVEKVSSVATLFVLAILALAMVFGIPGWHTCQPPSQTSPSTEFHIHQPSAAAPPPPTDFNIHQPPAPPPSPEEFHTQQPPAPTTPSPSEEFCSHWPPAPKKRSRSRKPPPMKIEWHKIRHIWSDR